MITNEMLAVAKYALNKYSIQAKFKIIVLDKKDWLKFSKEIKFLDIYYSSIKEEIEYLAESTLNLDDSLKEKMRKIADREKIIELEYSRILTLEDHLNSDSMIFNLTNSKVIIKLKDKIPFHYKLYKNNKNIDFLILLNLRLISNYPKEEILKSIIHETLHIVEAYIKQKHDFNWLENCTNVILKEFLYLSAPI